MRAVNKKFPQAVWWFHGEEMVSSLNGLDFVTGFNFWENVLSTMD
jgi:hypothetical protein